jgi:hypothetical protein
VRVGTIDGFLPVAATGNGEKLVYAPGEDGRPCGRIIVHDGEVEFYVHSTSFSEWLYRWLIGEDMVGEGSSAFVPGPVELRYLPMSYSDRPEGCERI